MKTVRILICVILVVFMLFTPGWLVSKAQRSFVDARFVRKEPEYSGVILLYHIVRQRPYAGSLTQWLKTRAEAFEKKHKGIYIEIEGMDEASFYERLENGRVPDAYSFFSGTLYRDRLADLDDFGIAFREGLFQTDRAVPYCYTGYCILKKTPDVNGGRIYCADDVLAARTGNGENDAPEDKADVLYLDLRRAGDLIRYKDGFALAVTEPIDNFTDAVCWLGVDRDTSAEKAEALASFFAFLLEEDPQKTLNTLGLMSVRADVRNVPPDAGLRKIFQTYERVRTVDPFLWNTAFDTLTEDAKLARAGNAEALERFTKRLHELHR